MLYRFIKDKSGNVERIGDIDAETLETKLQSYLDDGAVLANAEDHDQQVIGVLNKRVAELEAALGLQPGEAVPEKAAE